MRRGRDDDYHIYEVDADGRNLRQLTSSRMTADIGPAYLPDGRIVFSSTRDVKYCQCNRHICPNLFVMDADGGNVLQIGHNNLPELHASLLPDGRILYDRWEYVDRQFGPSFGLWTCNPDGTNHALYYGSNAWSPGAMIDARRDPGQPSRRLHLRLVPRPPLGRAGHRRSPFGDGRSRTCGPDLAAGSNRPAQGSSTISRWPTLRAYRRFQRGLAEVRRSLSAGRRSRPRIGQVFPRLAKHGKACPAGDPRMGIFLVDVFGNEVLLHDEEPSCFDPHAACGPRRAAGDSSRIDLRKTEGLLLCRMTFTGELEWSRCRAGTIKYLRIVEAPPKRSWSQQDYGIDAAQAPAMNWNVTVNKRIVGDVPVEADGSAYFSAPAGRFLFFQALDREQDDGPIDAQRHDPHARRSGRLHRLP